MRRHTAGRWEIARGIYGYSVVAPWPSLHPGSASSKCICQLPGDGLNPTLEQQANARLIASAPALLDALRWFVEEIGDPADPCRPSVDVIANARAIIAKAEGRV